MGDAPRAQLLGAHGHLRAHGLPDAEEPSVLHLDVSAGAFERQVRRVLYRQRIRHPHHVHHVHLLRMDLKTLVLALLWNECARDSQLRADHAVYSRVA